MPATFSEHTALLDAISAGAYRGEMELRGEGLTSPEQWLIHFGPHASEIAESGFLFGTPDVRRLALTYGSESAVPGYNFAILADDEYALRTISQYEFGLSAREAVLFQGEAVEVVHYDDFAQAVFWGPSIQGPFVRIRCPLDPDDPDDAGTLAGIEEPHDLPFEVLDKEGNAISSHPDMFSAIDAAMARGLEMGKGRIPGSP